MGNSITPITVKQNMLLCGNARWSPKGICLQPERDIDPISDDNLPLLTSLLDEKTQYGLYNLGINCIRVYQVEPEKNHDKVMALLASKGIYVMVGAVNSKVCITETSQSLAGNVVERVKAVADAFSKYDNVMGYDISNELYTNANQGNYKLVSITKQLKQHMQAHMEQKGYRAVPIGCCLRDVPSYTFPASEGYTCGNASERMDFIGYNVYRWSVRGVNDSVLDQYYLLYNQFKKFPVPVMLTENGAPCAGGRDWSDIPYVFGQKQVKAAGTNQLATLSDAISGCFAFRFYEIKDGEHHALVEPAKSPNPKPSSDSLAGGYTELSAAYKNVKTFPGSPNGVDKVDCSSLSGNPYAGSTPVTGGLPAPVKVTLTNVITNPASGRNMAFNYAMVANPGNSDWIKAVEIPAKGASKQFTFPKGTQAISMVYQGDKSSDWYEGCQLKGDSLLKLKDGSTIQGQWMSPDGHGSCPIL